MKEDWIEVELGKVLLIERGGSPRPIKEFITDDENGVNWIKIGDTKVNSKYIFGTAEKIRPEGLKKSRQVNEGDLLLSNSMSFGRPYILKTSGAIHDGWLVLKNKSELRIDAEYLYYVLSSPIIFAQFDKLATGSTVRNLNKDLVAKVISPIPSYPIQRAIVSKIETLFSDLDNGIADLKKAQEQLKIYRQAVLKKAFEGDYEIVNLSSVVQELSQGWSPRCKNVSSNNEKEWAVIKTSAIQHGAFIENENKILPDNLEPREQHEIKVGDILITRAGPRSRVGVCCLVKQTRPKLINCDKVYKLRLSDKILNDFFMYKMNSVEFLNKIEEIKTGGNDSGVNLTQNRFLNLEFDLPPVDKQKQIIKEIESRLSVCDKVEQNITEALNKSEALRQSILKKAFEGKLLSETEIAQCKQEADYEPAQKLLERIKQRKDAMHCISTEKKK